MLGYRRGNLDPSVKRYGATRFQSSDLPPRVDLRKQLTAVEQQGDTNSCTANAVAGAYEYLLKRHLGDEAYDVSRMFLYYNARAMHEGEDDMKDEGSVISKAVESLKTYGICSEETWPFAEDKVNERPSDEAFQEAAEFLIEDFAIVPTDLHAWKNCLAEGYPIIFGISLFNSFDQHRKPGLVPEPTPKEVSRASHGGHAMLCVGYSDKDQVFIVRNSWGPGWGDKGYCYIPYSYMMNTAHNDGDSWFIRRLQELAVDDSTWGGDESITGTYESELAEMSSEDYQAMLDDMDDVPLEARIGIILLHVAAADGDVSDAEVDEIANYMQEILVKLGSDLSAEKVLKTVAKRGDEEGMFENSVELVGKHLSNEMLATILNDIRRIVGTDDLAEGEQEMIDSIASEWQVESDE